MSTPKNKNTSNTKNTKKKEKLELSKGGMKSPKNSLFGRILLWFLIIAMLSTGIAFLIYTIVSSIRTI